MTGTRLCCCIGGTNWALMMIWERCYGDVDDVLSVSDVPVKLKKVKLSSSTENAPDASPSCPQWLGRVPVAYHDIETRLLCKVRYEETVHQNSDAAALVTQRDI